ncbi:MAG: lipopolysaccharide biosynthesis protein [Planctomycetota bacterium]
MTHDPDGVDGSHAVSATPPATAGGPRKRGFGGAVKWALVMKWGQYGSAALVQFVLMALLDVEDFGVVGMAWLYIAFIEMVLDQGFGAAIIQRKNLEQRHLESVFWLVLAVALGLTGVSVLLSGWWAAANHDPRIAAVIQVMSLRIPIQGLTTVQVALLQRSMDFRSLAVRNMSSVVVGGVIGISLALLGYGVWSLVAQQLSMALIALVLLWTVSGWRPGFRFSGKAMRELLGFSTGTFVAKVGVFVANKADEILVGLFFGTFAVGVYRSAMRLMSLVVELGSRAIGVAAFPKFAQAQDDPATLRRDLSFCFWLSSLLVIPGLALLAGVSDSLMATLGGKWLPAADVLKVLCLVGVAQSLTTFQAPMLQGTGRSTLFAGVVWGTAALSSGAFVVAGFVGRAEPESVQPLFIAWGRGGLYLGVFLPMSYCILRWLSGYSIAELMRAIRGPLTAGVAIFLGVRGLVWAGWGASWPPVVQLLVQGVFGVALGAGILLATDPLLRDKAGLLRAKLGLGGSR